MNINKLIYGGEPQDNKETIKISPRRVYKCVCGLISPRKDVRKVEGVYYCRCGEKVEDITDRETGQNLMEIINL